MSVVSLLVLAISEAVSGDGPVHQPFLGVIPGHLQAGGGQHGDPDVARRPARLLAVSQELRTKESLRFRSLLF